MPATAQSKSTTAELDTSVDLRPANSLDVVLGTGVSNGSAALVKEQLQEDCRGVQDVLAGAMKALG